MAWIYTRLQRLLELSLGRILYLSLLEAPIPQQLKAEDDVRCIVASHVHNPRSTGHAHIPTARQEIGWGKHNQ